VKLTIRPITQRAARAWITAHHRHLDAPRGDVIRCAVVDEAGEIRGVAMAGRPVSRRLDDGTTLEVTRVATDGATNACSMLYGALRRAAVALGFVRLVTYTLPEEGGASLRASGWREDGAAGGGSWSAPSRPRGEDLLLTLPGMAARTRTDVKTRWVWP